MDSKLETNGMVPGENPVTPHGADQSNSTEFGANVKREGGEDRQGMIAKLFSSYQSAKAQTKAEAAALHSPEWAGYESRSALMQKNAAFAPKSPSLTDQVRSLVGRR